VTVSAYRQVYEALPLDFVAKHKPPPAQLDRYPVTYVSFGRAREYAELAGKRLPTEAEYEFAATGGGKHAFPWGNDAGKLKKVKWLIGPVGRHAFDKLPTRPPVVGLFSEVAEWTDSLGTSYRPEFHPSVMKTWDGGSAYFKQYLRERVVRGGPSCLFRGELIPEELDAGARLRFMIAMHRPQPQLGFRCARSARPRFMD
jgi:formylglycine-generating enzyme required for sulfatase activity